LNLGTQLPGVPLSGAKENTYFATAPARNLHNKPILLGKWSGATVNIFYVPNNTVVIFDCAIFTRETRKEEGWNFKNRRFGLGLLDRSPFY
jgi:hypothetical protein